MLVHLRFSIFGKITSIIENLFIYTAIFSELLPILIYIFFFKSTRKEKPLKILFIYSLCFFICELIDNININNRTNKIYFYSFITLFEYTLFNLFIFILTKNKNIKKIILFFIAAFIAFQAIFTYFTPIVLIDSVSIGIETILILFFSFYFLYEQINKPETVFLYNTYHFWIITGFIIYFSGSFFVYLFASYIPQKELRIFWLIINIFSILKNIFFSIGILVFALHQDSKIKHKSFHYNLTR